MIEFDWKCREHKTSIVALRRTSVFQQVNIFKKGSEKKHCFLGNLHPNHFMTGAFKTFAKINVAWISLLLCWDKLPPSTFTSDTNIPKNRHLKPKWCPKKHSSLPGRCVCRCFLFWVPFNGPNDDRWRAKPLRQQQRRGARGVRRRQGRGAAGLRGGDVAASFCLNTTDFLNKTVSNNGFFQQRLKQLVLFNKAVNISQKNQFTQLLEQNWLVYFKQLLILKELPLANQLAKCSKCTIYWLKNVYELFFWTTN